MLHCLDHLVLTTARLDDCVRFYTEVLGMRLESFGAGRMALHFGDQKINIHELGKEFEPKAAKPTPGSLDLCFIAALPLEGFIAHCAKRSATIVEGPVERTGATSRLRSVYLRDPDGNLIEVSERL